MGVVSESNVFYKCRVLYIGSAVPLETSAGLEAIQLPLRERYPVDSEANIEGIDAELTVTGHDLQLIYLSQSDTVIQFPISSLTLCAAVRCVETVNGATGEKLPKFVSLNDPLAKTADSTRPAIFTAITRRSQGLKVLECHGFICGSPRDALALVKAAATAGERLKSQGTTSRSTVTRRPVRGFSSYGDTTQEARMSFRDSFRESVKEGSEGSPVLNRTSSVDRPPVNGVVNGPAMRLIPGEPVGTNVAAGPEFFEPVSQQGYFYSSDKTEVRKYNITKLRGDTEPPLEPVPVPSVPPPTRHIVNGGPPPPRHIVNGGPVHVGPPPPVFVRRGQPPPRPIIVGPPPPPPPLMPMRPRFFSPPPPRLRPMPVMVPPRPGPPPPPMYATPVFIRRRKPGSRSSSGSKSRSVTPTGSHGSRSKSPKEQVPGVTEPKRIPNGDADTSSNSSHDRPRSPPTDYEKRIKGKRMSRREEYEIRNLDGERTPTRHSAYTPDPIYIGIERMPPAPYDYYVYPPRHGGYAPFTMYNPHGRSRSVPPQARYTSKSPHRRGKKSKKVKKPKSRKHRDRRLYERYNMASDISTDSYAGYHSEIPVSRQRPATGGYEFYPPRDFRRDENQFMNERNFSRSIVEENRRDSKPPPTAYELNEALTKSRGHTDELEGDFTLY